MPDRDPPDRLANHVWRSRGTTGSEHETGARRHTAFKNIIESARVGLHFDIESDQKDSEIIFGESYVPITKEGRFLGIVELYIDFTEQYNQAKNTVWAVFLSTSILVIALIGINVFLLRYYLGILVKTDAALKESEEKYRKLVEGSIQGILVQREQKPLFVNKAFAEIFGYATPGDVLELPSLESLIAPEDRAKMTDFRIARLEGREAPSRYEGHGVRADGRKIWLDTIVSTVMWDDKPALQVALVDITD